MVVPPGMRQLCCGAQQHLARVQHLAVFNRRHTNRRDDEFQCFICDVVSLNLSRAVRLLGCDDAWQSQGAVRASLCNTAYRGLHISQTSVRISEVHHSKGLPRALLYHELAGAERKTVYVIAGDEGHQAPCHRPHPVLAPACLAFGYQIS
jgi:hypothetical protein